MRRLSLSEFPKQLMVWDQFDFKDNTQTLVGTVGECIHLFYSFTSFHTPILN
jgi:hypothetical protein